MYGEHGVSDLTAEAVELQVRRHAGRSRQQPVLLFGGPQRNFRRDALRRRLLAAGDVLALAAAYALLWVVQPPVDAWTTDIPLLIALPSWVLLNKSLRLYDRDAHHVQFSTLDELPRLALSLTIGVAFLFMFAPLIPGVELHRETMTAFWAMALVLTPTARAVARTAVRHRTAPERVAIVGSGHVASLLAVKLLSVNPRAVQVVGYVDEGEHGPVEGIDRLGGLDQFREILSVNAVDRIIIAFSRSDHEELLDLIREAKRQRLKISIVPRLFEVIGHAVEMDQVQGLPLMGLRGLSRTRSTLMLKRATDFVGALVVLVLAAPLLAVAAAAVKLTSPGPVLFRQQRRGRNDGEFQMLKLRTMYDGADDLRAELMHLNEMPGGTMFKMADDPRVTRVGRLLRRTSIDELPQLWNVLKGEMSLVGPRPLVPAEDDAVEGWHRARLDLTPGLTGPWQVLGRNAIPFGEMVKIDYLYVAEWSLWNDIKLICRTVPVVLMRRGA